MTPRPSIFQSVLVVKEDAEECNNTMSVNIATSLSGEHSRRVGY